MEFKGALQQRNILAILTIVLLISSFLFMPTKASAAIVRETTVDFLSETSSIVIEFDRGITTNTTLNPTPNTPSNSFTGIRLVDTSDPTTSISIRFEVRDGRFLHIIPASPLKKNTSYRVSITDHIVLGSSAPASILPGSTVNKTLNFSTYSLTFEELMSGTREINTLIDEYTPRKMIVTAPIRYIQQTDIVHKRQEVLEGRTTESVTNIDVSITDVGQYNANGDINRIEVIARSGTTILRRQELEHLNVTPNMGTRVYDFGFTRLPDTRAFDIDIILYDNDGDILDQRLVKVPYETNNITTVRQRDRFRMAGRSFSLYQLMTNTRDFQALLTENKMKELKVKVTE